MRRFFAVAGLMGVVGIGAMSFAMVPSAETQAASTRSSFTIPANDGYGIGECLSSGSSSCAKVVADAWCEAQGFQTSASIALVRDVDSTASITPATRAPISITCKE